MAKVYNVYTAQTGHTEVLIGQVVATDPKAAAKARYGKVSSVRSTGLRAQ